MSILDIVYYSVVVGAALVATVALLAQYFRGTFYEHLVVSYRRVAWPERRRTIRSPHVATRRPGGLASLQRGVATRSVGSTGSSRASGSRGPLMNGRARAIATSAAKPAEPINLAGSATVAERPNAPTMRLPSDGEQPEIVKRIIARAWTRTVQTIAGT